MRRLAVVTVGTIVLAGVAPATAGLGDSDESSGWCADHADLSAQVRAAGSIGVVAGVGTTTDRPVQSAFACLEAGAARHEADGLVTAFVDPQYGRAGWSCARQPATEALTCKRTSVPLPGRASGRVDSTDNQWTVTPLGVGVAYEIQSPTTRAAARLPESCLRHVCRGESEHRAWARPGETGDPQAETEAQSDDERAAAGVEDTTVTAPAPPRRR